MQNATPNVNTPNATTPTPNTEQTPISQFPSFEELWAKELENFMQATASMQPTAKAGVDEGDKEESDAEPQVNPEFAQLAAKVVVQESLSQLTKEYPELAELGIIDLTKQYLSTFPLNLITPDLARATALMFYGLHALKRKDYDRAVEKQKAGQTPSLPPDEDRQIQRYAEIWGLDPDDLRKAMLEEVQKR